MQNIKKTSLIVILIMIISGCDKLPDPAGRRGIAVVPALTDVNPGIFDSKDLENSYIEFKITIPEGTMVEKISVVGSYQDNYERIVLKEVTTFPATVKILSSDIAQKLGIQLNTIKNGDVFTVELLTLANGITTRSIASLFVPVACAYRSDLAAGSYHSLSPDWNSEGNITLTADASDPYKIYVRGLEEIEGLVEDLGPLVMYINPGTFNVTVPNEAVASDAWGYGAISYSGNGVYSSCEGSYIMNFDISLGAYGSQGTYKFTFTRNP
jgi:hypothetical protein